MQIASERRHVRRQTPPVWNAAGVPSCRLRAVFLTALGADESQIEVSFCEAIGIAKEQKLSFAEAFYNYIRDHRTLAPYFHLQYAPVQTLTLDTPPHYSYPAQPPTTPDPPVAMSRSNHPQTLF